MTNNLFRYYNKHLNREHCDVFNTPIIVCYGFHNINMKYLFEFLNVKTHFVLYYEINRLNEGWIISDFTFSFHSPFEGLEANILHRHVFIVYKPLIKHVYIKIHIFIDIH